MDTEELLAELKEKLELLQKLEAAFAGVDVPDAPTSGKKKRKPMSAKARKKIALAQKKRWKLYHAEQKKEKAKE